MLKVGMIVAVELFSVRNVYGDADEKYDFTGFKVLRYDLKNIQLYVVKSGAGEIAAAAATQFLITKFGVDMISNFGVAGALTNELSLGDICLVDSVVHYEFDVSELLPESESKPILTDRKLLANALSAERYPLVACASGNRFVGSPESRRALAEQSGCQIAEMEAAGVLITSNLNGIPCLMLKAVSDGPETEMQEIKKSFGKISDDCMKALKKILEEF